MISYPLIIPPAGPPDDPGPRQIGPKVDWDCHVAVVKQTRRKALIEGFVLGGVLGAWALAFVGLLAGIMRGWI